MFLLSSISYALKKQKTSRHATRVTVEVTYTLSSPPQSQLQKKKFKKNQRRQKKEEGMPQKRSGPRLSCRFMKFYHTMWPCGGNKSIRGNNCTEQSALSQVGFFFQECHYKASQRSEALQVILQKSNDAHARKKKLLFARWSILSCILIGKKQTNHGSHISWTSAASMTQYFSMSTSKGSRIHTIHRIS
jgi:hypothetical protein